MASDNDFQKVRNSQELLDKVAALRARLVDQVAADLIENPQLGEALKSRLDDVLHAFETDVRAQQPPADRGLAQLVGLGDGAAQLFGDARIPPGVVPYDEKVTSERIVALGDLYYLYQHERLGVFRAVQKLQELFRAGTVHLSGGEGAFALYQFDRREVLRYTRRDRHSAYARAFGFGPAAVPGGASANTAFSRLFTTFVDQVALFWRDKRISDVIRERAQDPSFGSIAVVRRAGLDLRDNLKYASYGHLNVMRVEVMQLLEEAFRILAADDVKRLFGADNAWEVVHEVLHRHLGERAESSPRQRMAIAGRDLLRWLAQSHILESSRSEFEALLLDVAEDAEEWLTSAASVGVGRQRPRARDRTLRPHGAVRPVRRPGAGNERFADVEAGWTGPG